MEGSILPSSLFLLPFIILKGVVSFTLINNEHIFAQHHIFIPCVNKNLTQFVQSWSAHVVSRTGGKTPMQMWIEGQFQMQRSHRGSVFEELTEVLY